MLRSWRWVPVLLVALLLNLGFAAEGVARAWGRPEWKAADDAERVPRFVVLGFDGVDPRILREYLEKGDLPAIRALVERNGLHELRSEIPPESPVAWSSMLTGVNPGRHRVFDFLARNPKGYVPVNGIAEIDPPRFLLGKVPVRPPRVRSHLAYPTFLERVSAAGYRVLALRQPMLFPARELPGAETLAGLGTPDVAGTNGAYAIYQAGFGFASPRTVFNGTRIRLDAKPETRVYDTVLEGPFDPTGRESDGGKRRITVPLRFERGGREDPVTITVGGSSVRVAPGERSPWMRVTFEIPSWPARAIPTRARFEVKSTDPLEVLCDPVQIDATSPVLPISWPNAFSGDLEQRYGPYKTTGWTEQTFMLNDGTTTEAAFLKDLLEDMEHGEAVLRGELARGGRCVFSCFTQTDRAAHCFFWRRDGERHPAWDAMAFAALPDPLRDVYKRMDRIVGGVVSTLGKDDVLLVASDHGFASWRRGMNVNQWLMDEGYLVPSKDDAGRPEDAPERTLGDFFAERLPIRIDWSKTRAYAIGLGQIYVNRRGREVGGVVEDGDVDALVAEIERKILAFKDVDGTPPVAKVYRLHDLYSGPYRAEAAEIQLGFRPGYRVSWQTALLGGLRQGGPVCENNTVAWSGDHCSTDRDAVPGVLLSNRPIPPAPKDRPYDVRAIAASALAHFGLDGSDLDGTPLPLGPAAR